MNRHVGLLCSLVAAAVAWGCSSTPHKIADEEMSADWSGQRYDDLLVIGVYEDRAYRIGAESAFADVLKSHAVAATPSYDRLPRLDTLEREQDVARELVDTQHDALLVVATLDEGYDYDAGDYFATRGIVYLLGGRPGAATNMGSFIAWAGSGFYSLYVGVWDVETLKPVWEVTTDSKTTGSESGDTQALARFVYEAMRERGLVGASSGALPASR